MIEDKLSYDERVRLECLAQSIQNHTMGPKPSPRQLIDEAKIFEEYVRDKPPSVPPMTDSEREYGIK